MRTDIEAFYTQPSGRLAPDISDQLADAGIREIGALVSEQFVYDMVAAPFYDVELSQEQADGIHLRSTDDMLELLGAATGGLQPRAPRDRVGGRCSSYTRLAVELLRAKGIPARARCGFGAAFNPPKYEDHWVCEYWDDAVQQWRMADAQFDDVWRQNLNLDYDQFDVPRDTFLVAADAWQLCRTGQADPNLFGISFEPLSGMWFIAGSLVRDAAALNNMQMLPWDYWGATPEPNTELSDDDLALYDHIAGLTRDPDASFDELRRVYQTDDRLMVPDTVYNGLRDRQESVGSMSLPCR